MRYEIDAGGRTRRVTVTRTGATFAVSVDGQTRQVDAARIDAHTLSLVVDSVWPKETIVSTDPASGQLIVRIDGMPIAVAVNGRRGRRDDGGPAGTGPQRVVAPMAGKVTRVLVAPGETVKGRQPLVVVEAMKMENELRAARDGSVAEVHVRQGQSVDAGTLLVVVQ